MDSLPSHHFHLAQMPTDHPEHEHHHPLAIMGSSSPADGILQVNASQPYDPCPSIENWARFRSNPASEPLMPLLQSGYTNLWSSAAAEPYELSPTHLPPSYLDSFYSTSTTAPIMTSPSSMGHLSPGLNPHHDSEDQLSPVKVETITSPSFNPETFYHHRAQLEMPGSDFLAEPSPPFANTDKSLLSLSQESIRPVMTAPATESTSSRRTVWGNSEETYGSDPPYSELIYQALKSAPDMKLSLQGVYSWFERNTTKGKDQKKGWQNSIRHNLSMNAGFEAIKEKTTSGKKPVNFWRLTGEAIQHGIKSTTRYRKQANHKRALSTDPLSPQHQRSGSKVGKVTKTTARVRHSKQDELRKERHRRLLAGHRRQPPSPYWPQTDINAAPIAPTAAPTCHPSRTLTALPPGTTGPPIQVFDSSGISGCTNLSNGDHAIFCDTAVPGPECVPFDMGYLGWSSLSLAPTEGLGTADNLLGLQLSA